MRGRTAWTMAVPALLRYQRLVTVRNPRQKALSRRNLDRFDLIETALII